jgi:hypothetical protein
LMAEIRTTPLKEFVPTDEHRKLMDAWKKAVGEEGANLDSAEICAMAAQFLGNLVGLLDQRIYTPRMAMDMVTENLVTGNQEVMKSLLGTEGEG